MPITYTESWAQSFNEDLDTREVTVEYHIRSTDAVITAFNYKAATKEGSGDAFPVKGQVRPEDQRYRLHRYTAPRMQGPRYAIVSTVWRIGPFGGEQVEEDPLNNPIRYRWRPITESEPTDSDADGNPLLNSAGDPFSSTVNGFINSYLVEATRNEAAFDPSFSVAFQNKLNEGSFTIAGKVLEAGEALCTGIYPPGDYTLEDDYVPITYQFKVRDRLTLSDGRRITSFVYRLLDQGRRGWTYDDRKVAIYDRNGNSSLDNPTPVAFDVPLDEGVPRGEPADAGKNFFSVEPNFDPPDRGWVKNNQVGVPPLLAQDKDPDTGVTFLYYKKHLETDYSGLNL